MQLCKAKEAGRVGGLSGRGHPPTVGWLTGWGSAGECDGVPAAAAHRTQPDLQCGSPSSRVFCSGNVGARISASAPA